MKTPDWVREVIRAFENRNDPFQEVEVAEALARASKAQGEVPDEESKSLLAEWSAFLFGEKRDKDGVWGTYFEPMITMRRQDGQEVHSPDIKGLDANIVAHWEERARTCGNPVMRSRYADAVWDLKVAITGERPSVEYAQIAVDSYLEATDKKFYEMEVMGIQWLGRALDLARSINDANRVMRVVAFMFEFYGRVAQVKFAGTWLFLFDNLYGQKFISSEQEALIIQNLEEMLAKTSDTTPSADGVYLNFDPWAAEAAAQRLAQHYRRHDDKPNVARVIKAYGGAFEHMARQASGMMATAWLPPVIERYEQEGLRKEAEGLQGLAEEKAKSVASELKTVSVPVEIKPEDVRKLVDYLLGSEDLNTSLIRVGEYFIPKVDDARKLLDRLRTDAPFLSMIPIVIVESGGSPTAKIGSLDDDTEGRLHKQLGQTIAFYQPFLEHVLGKLRERYSPTVDEILDFLCHSPLFVDGKGGLLRDGLLAYQEEDFIKAIHVLVPQVEHALRTFLGKLGIPIRKTVRNHPGITDAKNMNDALTNPRMRSVLSENLWRYLTIVYIDRRGGLNLRNDLAHGLVSPHGLKRHMADRVFHTLLSLSLIRERKGIEERGGSSGAASSPSS